MKKATKFVARWRGVHLFSWMKHARGRGATEQVRRNFPSNHTFLATEKVVYSSKSIHGGKGLRLTGRSEIFAELSAHIPCSSQMKQGLVHT